MNRSKCLEKIHKARRVVIKVGSSLLTESDRIDGVNLEMIRKLRDEIMFLRGLGKDVLLVSSGAVSMGREVLRRYARGGGNASSVARKQALSAVGQSRLMSVYREVFEDVDIPVAQLLITARDFLDRRAYLNIGSAIHELVSLGVLAIINENDTVSTEEIQFGDNDLLSAACASLFHADLLVILTRVDGFLKDNERVPFLPEITQDVMDHAGGPTGPGSGGMITKIRAAQLCGFGGESTAILPGNVDRPVQRLFNGDDIGTLVCAKQSGKLSARKRWLLYARTQGAVHVDDGARDALMERGSSLLPAGIFDVEGDFIAGDIIEIIDSTGRNIGRGIVNYSHNEVTPAIGKGSDQIRREGHIKRSTEVIHRNNLILEV